MKYFRISWYSVTDGPGTRVVLFLQGCNLHCKWCHSPYSIPSKPPVQYFENFCNVCGRCAQVCHKHCHTVENGIHRYSRSNCTLCLQCVQECRHGALIYEYKEASPKELYYRIKPELELLGKEGGLTVSGGEPLLQWQEVRELLKMCKADGFHTAVETSAGIAGEGVMRLNEVTDCWLFGLKQTDPKLCREMTGADMEVILANLETIAKDSADKIIIRTPLIPGYTDDEKNLTNIHNIMGKYHIQKQELLPMNSNTEHYYNARRF